MDVAKRMAAKVKHFNNPTVRRSLNGEKPSTREMLGLTNGEDLQEVTSIKGGGGVTLVKFQETFKGVSVYGEGVVMAKDSNGEWTGEANGQLVEGIADDLPSVTPTLSKQDAIKMSVNAASVDETDVDVDESSDVHLKVMIQNVKGDPQRASANLAYVVSFRLDTPHGLSRPYYVIDATTGKVLDTWEGITNIPPLDELEYNYLPDMESSDNLRFTRESNGNSVTEKKMVYVTGDGGNVGRGRHMYGGKYKKLLVTQIGERCYLTNDKVDVLEFSICNYSSNYLRRNVTKIHNYGCYEGNHDFANGAYSPSNDAYYYSQECYNMYNDWYNTKPLKFKIKVKVHFMPYANAFWDGRHIIFLDGSRRFFPLTEPSIVGHELSHGFTEHHSGLRYRSQSGGINEAFSDMAGEALEYYLDKKTDYLIGKNIAKKNGTPFRYMQDPSMDGRSISTFDDFCEGIDVHLSSGVFNRAFYLLSKEKGWGPKKAFHPFVVANQLYWRETSGFHDGACGVAKAASDLGYQKDDVIEVFRKVGVVPCLRVPNDVAMGGVGGLKVVGRGQQDLVWKALAGTKTARISLSGGTGEAHMVVKYGSRYTHSRSLTYKSAHTGSDQTVEFPNPTPGNYYITIFTNTGYEDARVDVSYDYSGILKVLTDSELIEKRIKVYRGRSQNYTYAFRIYSLNKISLEDFLQVEIKETGRRYVCIVKGSHTKGAKLGRPETCGLNIARVCKVTAKEYHVVVVERIKTEKSESADGECETCNKKKSKMVPVYAMSGTKVKLDKSNGC